MTYELLMSRPEPAHFVGGICQWGGEVVLLKSFVWAVYVNDLGNICFMDNDYPNDVLCLMNGWLSFFVYDYPNRTNICR